MKAYIDKSALLAEIDKSISNYKGILNKVDKSSDNWVDSALMLESKIDVLQHILYFLDTLEVKEVDLEKEITQFLDIYFPNAGIGHKLSLRRTAKHFYELGLKAKDWEKERMEECPYRQVGCIMYEGKILECRGACSWVVDYQKLKELKAQKGDKIWKE